MRLSRTTWMSSLISICFSRPNIILLLASLFQPLVEAARGHQREHQREAGQRQQVRDEHGGRRSFEKDLLEHRDVIAGREDARDPLQRDRHLLDGKQESRQAETREET